MKLFIFFFAVLTLALAQHPGARAFSGTRGGSGAHVFSGRQRPSAGTKSTKALTTQQVAALQSARAQFVSSLKGATGPSGTAKLKAASSTYQSVIDSQIGITTVGACADGHRTVVRMSTDFVNAISLTKTEPCTVKAGK